MLYVLVVTLCMGMDCEDRVWASLLPIWDCLDRAYELNVQVTIGSHTVHASCKPMFKTRGLEV